MDQGGTICPGEEDGGGKYFPVSTRVMGGACCFPGRAGKKGCEK